MIGEIRWSFVPYYDVTRQQMSHKKRPVLIIANADVDDYVVIPLSRVTMRAYLDPVYDVEIDPAVFPKLNLTRVSYARTHKQLTIHLGEIGNFISSMKMEYPELYLDILEKREQFSAEITAQALS